MKHHRSPTLSYPQDAVPLPIHATLALRHPSTQTLLSPLRSIGNTPPHGAGDAVDDLQSNAWVNASSYRPPLAGLGITYLRDAFATLHGQPLVSEDASMQMQVDGDEGLLFLPEIRGTDIPLYDFPAPGVPHRGLESEEDCCMAKRTPNFDPSVRDAPAGHLELGLDSDIDLTASNTIGLIPDVNMFDKLRRVDWSHPGVNPLDTIRATPLHDLTIPLEQPTTPIDSPDGEIFPARPEQCPSPQVIQDIMSILVQPAPGSSSRSRSYADSPSAQCFSPSQLGQISSVSVRVGSTNVLDSEHPALPAPCNLDDPDAALSPPILNAHLGIELNELISRAERFRSKHPERDIDRAWLSHFAGKLSDRGELLSDFRCYVIGCDQRNKRRDHILVHVGAHIGQRPFACSVCSLRFLRKNECKRHEASHSGFKPYSCDICGQSFVRQDLVKRHVKRTHGMRDENEPSIAKQSAKKRARLR